MVNDQTSQTLPEYKWTMVVDLDRCTGCSACVIACHAENNVPIVNEDQVWRGRGMHWIHLQRYWEGDYPAKQARFIPTLCQQCGKGALRAGLSGLRLPAQRPPEPQPAGLQPLRGHSLLPEQRPLQGAFLQLLPAALRPAA